MNKTAALLSLSYALSMMAMMNNPAIMAVSPDTKIVLTLLYFISLVNVALFMLGLVFERFLSLMEKFYKTSLFKKLQSKFSRKNTIAPEKQND